jgi:ketosteroid isomerase-like protein
MTAVDANYEALTRALWDAYGRGGADALCALLDDDVEWQPSSGTVLHGPAEIARYVDEIDSRITAVPQVYETHGDCVLVHGSLRRFRDGGFLDVQPSWVYFFRARRLLGATAYASRAAALAAIEDFASPRA